MDALQLIMSGGKDAENVFVPFGVELGCVCLSFTAYFLCVSSYIGKLDILDFSSEKENCQVVAIKILF